MTTRRFIVVVDDDPSVRKALARLLRTARMDVETFPSAEEFLLALQTSQPDCLVLDIRMPGITGRDLRDRLVALRHRIPIVFITAHAEDVAVEQGTSGEDADVLHKPFGDEALLTAIDRSIRRGESM